MNAADSDGFNRNAIKLIENLILTAVIKIPTWKFNWWYFSQIVLSDDIKLDKSRREFICVILKSFFR